MIPPDDDPHDDPVPGPADEPSGPPLPLDEDAAWRAIVDNYGERPKMGAPAPEAPTGKKVSPAPEPVGTDAFDRSYLDSLEARRAAERRREEEHFVPPVPPPVPSTTPARRLAWAGLFGAPVMMIAAVVFGLSYPTWASVALVTAFVGGFVYLVLTMPRNGSDGWDDGAVV